MVDKRPMISAELASAVMDKAREHGVAAAASFTEVPLTKIGLLKLRDDCRAAGEKLMDRGVTDDARKKALRCAIYVQVFTQLSEGNEGYARVTLEL